MSFFWQRRVYDVLSPRFYTPLDLHNRNDRYFEDFSCFKRDENTVYEGVVKSIGVRHCYPEYHFFNRLSDRYSLHYILGGTGWVGDRAVHAGDVVFFDRNQIHNFSSDSKDPCYYTWITFKGPGCEHLLKSAGFLGRNGIFRLQDLTEICEIFYDMLYNQHPKDQTEIYFESCFYRLISLTSKGTPRMEEVSQEGALLSTVSAHVDRGLTYIETHYQDPDFKIEKIGPSIGLSDVYFRRIFKQKLGYSPKQYLIRYRLEAATTMLCSTEKSVTEIAGLAGFHDYRHFFELFHKYVGETPTDFRNRARLKKQ